MYWSGAAICTFLFVTYTSGAPPVIRVGALFPKHTGKHNSELAFRYAVHRLNRDKSLLPETNIVYDIEYVSRFDSFETVQKVCRLVQVGVQAIFSPTDSVLATHINSICDALDIPDIGRSIHDFSINVHPSQQYVNNAFIDVIRYLNWTRFGILYEKDYGIINLHQLSRSVQAEVHMRKVSQASYLSVLNEFKNKEIHNIIIDINSDGITALLKNILQQQMNEYKYHYFFTSFDLETFDLEDFKYNFVNITSFRLVDIGDVAVKEILKDLEFFGQQMFQESDANLYLRKAVTIETEPALMFDSVYVFAIGLQTLEQSHTLYLSNLTCDDEIPWNGGLSLINYINSVEWKGLTGPIQFKEGQRVQFKLDLIKLKQHSIVKVGEWTPQGYLNITDPSMFFDSGSMNVTLVVITILETPYVMMNYGKNFTGNERFFGFCVDILETISHEVGFDYILDLVPDRKYGAKDPETGEWNGMVAQLMKYKADLAVGSMTITYARESVIDFTKPFMNLGISILFKVPESEPTRLFSFMNPLAIEIWIYVLIAYFLVSISIYIVGKLSPIEWHCIHPCDLDNITIGNQFTMSDSFWFTIGTLMQQSPDIYPRATSTRIISSIWGFFSLIIVASYTANLAAFLTTERMINPIENADDLATQTEISYGTLESGSTMTFFRDSMIETYKKMWRSMDNKKPSAFTTTYEDGIRRVNQGNYAFLMESTMLDYIVQRDCNLTQIGGLLDTKGYGIATPKGSPWRDKISLAILELQEKGDIQMLYDKWWKNTDETCTRRSTSKQSKANALGLESIGGVFVVLIAGIIVAVIVAFFEFWFNFQCNEKSKPLQKNICRSAEEGIRQSDSECVYIPPNRSFWIEMFEELRYASWCMNKPKKPELTQICDEDFLTMITRYRFLHRHLAIGALYLLLTITVLGLIYVLSIFNSTELPFMVKSPSLPVQSSKYQQKSMINIDDDKDNRRGNSNGQTTPLPLNSREASDDDQQHIYIDDVYKPFKPEYLSPLTSKLTPNGLQGHHEPHQLTSEFGSGKPTRNSNNNFNKFDRFRDTYVDNEEASGSGTASFDTETRKFIKRINLRLLKKAAANMTAGRGGREDDRSHNGRRRNMRIYTNKKPIFNFPTKKMHLGSTKSLGKGRSLMEDDRKQERRIISNEKESADRSRKLLLCEKETESGVGVENELCRMLFKES
ncbi:glutamate receptor ionotropic, kainate 2 isoform X2 [Drosophila obscura]|uniref:glutamate receptor ionotropic, kainate 2 isoform X2 n=1 Tax=Drosophila obscura TaxID=7282 RepID=UPI000BA14C6D|nr:glutamate receptor ionotropic, kainate 2 isoform X2 [Drosophila obscura]